MKLNIFSNQKISIFKSKLLTILANKNKSIGAMYYGNVCQNSHSVNSHKVSVTNFMNISAFVCHNCIIV